MVLESFQNFLMSGSRDSEHLHNLKTIFGSVSVEMVVEDAEGSFCVLGDFFHFGRPFLELWVCVTVVIPWMLAVSMPSDVTDV